MRRKIPDEKKIMRQMAEIAFNPEEKTADRLRALDMLSDYLKDKNQSDDAFAKLDEVLESIIE
jgi:predicted NACHT family NTPase